MKEIECLRCGECCRIRGSVRVNEDEIGRISSFIGVERRDFIERYTRLAHNRYGLELQEKDNGECVFLSGNDCLIQPVKPAQCRAFPRGWRYPGAELICPGIRNVK